MTYVAFLFNTVVFDVNCAINMRCCNPMEALQFVSSVYFKVLFAIGKQDHRKWHGHADFSLTNIYPNHKFILKLIQMVSAVIGVPKPPIEWSRSMDLADIKFEDLHTLVYSL